MDNQINNTPKISQVNNSNIPKRNRLEQARKLWYKFSLSKLSVVGLTIILLVVFCAIFAPFIAPYPEDAGAVVNYSQASQAPSLEHIFGTDTSGRDLFSRILFSFRGALIMGVGCLAVVVPVGGILGLIAGYYNGIMTPSLMNAMLALCVSWWPWYTRLVNNIVVSTRNEVYIRSAEVLGASNTHILFKQILPNALGPILTKVTLDMGWAIMAGATLSFIGMGEQPPTPSLGSMVSAGVSYMPDQWWLSTFPALAIMLIVLGFNLAGDGIKDMLSSDV